MISFFPCLLVVPASFSTKDNQIKILSASWEKDPQNKCTRPIGCYIPAFPDTDSVGAPVGWFSPWPVPFSVLPTPSSRFSSWNSDRSISLDSTLHKKLNCPVIYAKLHILVHSHLVHTSSFTFHCEVLRIPTYLIIDVFNNLTAIRTWRGCTYPRIHSSVHIYNDLLATNKKIQHFSHLNI